jgi:hypothetical protein
VGHVEKGLGHEGGSFINVIIVFINETSEGYLAPSNIWGELKSAIYKE